MPSEPMPESLPESLPSQPAEVFPDYLPEDATTFSDEGAALPDPSEIGGGVHVPEGVDAAPPKKKVNMSKRMKKSMDKFMRQIAEMPGLYFNNLASQNPEWALDDDEKELLSDSVTMVFEILDVGFEIEPLSMKLTSIWWILAYPFCVFGYIFFNKKQKIDTKGDIDAA